MNRIIVLVGIILLVGLIVLGVFSYINRSSSVGESSPAPLANGFQPLNRNNVISTTVPTSEQSGSTPYATTTSPANQTAALSPAYQPAIVTEQSYAFSEPFIQSTQTSPVMDREVVTQPIQQQETPPPDVTELQPIPSPSQTLVETGTSPISNLTPYIPYSGPTYSIPYSGPTYSPSSTIPIVPGVIGGGGGGGGGSGETPSILITLGTVAIGALLGGLGGSLIGSLLGGGLSSLFGGGGGGGGISGGGSGNFGGKITNVTYCTCSISLMLDIADVRGWPISLLFSLGSSHLYADYNIFAAGPEVLGTYTPSGGQCEVYDGESCNSQGFPQGTIKIIGTSAQ